MNVDADKRQREYFSWRPQEDPEFAPMIYGGGTIGGKGRSLLFAIRKLRDSGDPLLAATRLPDSIYFGIDIFHEFLDSVPALDALIAQGDTERLESVFLSTPLPRMATEAVRGFLANMQSPLVVRSSSRLEDSVKHSFAGKYRSTFLINTSISLDERAKAVEDEIRRIYARVYFPKATSYREKHALGGDDMGIIVIRMAGRKHGPYYYPAIAGVGYSQNYRRWSTTLKQEDGVLRMVFGMGTMSTKRGYARTVSLTNPRLRPEGQNPDKVAFHAQESFHVVSEDNRNDITTLNIKQQWKHLLEYHPDFNAFAQVYNYEPEGGYFTSLDNTIGKLDGGSKVCFTFENFPTKYPRFFERMKKTLSLLEYSMGVPADIEFAANPMDEHLALIQSRPSWSPIYNGAGIPDLTGRRIVLQANRMVTPGAAENVGALIYVDHNIYYSEPDFYAVARGIGELNRTLGEKYILVAPGRVGASNPELGVPVQYNELTNCRCIVELGIARQGFMPELSYGTHFFSDLAVDDVLYMPVFEGEGSNVIDREWLENGNWTKGPQAAIKIFRGKFSAYMDDTHGYIIAD